MEKIPMTAEGFAQVEAELKRLKSVERPAIIAAISEAREHGDLSENAEYHAAKEKQSFNEGRIKELEATVSLAQVIDTSKMSGDTVRFGAHVLIADDEEEKIYQIVGEPEADIEKNKISIASPLAKAIIGKSVGDAIQVSAPGGMREYEIVQVKYQ